MSRCFYDRHKSTESIILFRKLKNAHLNYPEPCVASLNCLFWLTNNLNLKPIFYHRKRRKSLLCILRIKTAAVLLYYDINDSLIVENLYFCKTLLLLYIFFLEWFTWMRIFPMEMKGVLNSVRNRQPMKKSPSPLLKNCEAETQRSADSLAIKQTNNIYTH